MSQSTWGEPKKQKQNNGRALTPGTQLAAVHAPAAWLTALAMLLGGEI